jgi:hypothetical protein
MIPCGMPVRSVGMFGCLYLVPLPGLSDHLISYTVTSKPPLFSVSVVTNITWSSSMIVLTTHGPFRYAISPTLSSPSLTSLHMCPHNLNVLSKVSSALMDTSLISPSALSSSLTTSSSGYHVPIHPSKQQGLAHDSYHQGWHVLFIINQFGLL